MQQKAYANGFIRAVANQHHPFQTEVTLILTDFEPNNNKQGVPKTEAENILRTALFTPLKINFDGEEIGGHVGATPIGSITYAALDKDDASDVIIGRAVIWNDIYTNESDYLKQAFAEGVGTSWEIYFEDSHNDDNGIQWLEGCVFGGTCVVNKPAYGSNRTRFLAIAEQLDNRANNKTELNINMAKDNTAKADDQAVVNDVRSDMSQVMDILSSLYNSLYEKMDQTYELESKLVTNDMTAMAEQLTKLVASIDKRFNSLIEKANAGDSAIAELTTLKDQIATAETQRLENEKKEVRRSALAEVGITTEDLDFYIKMDDGVFDHYITDLKAVKALNKSEASDKDKTPIIPDPTNNSVDNVLSIKEIAAAIRGK